MLGITAAVGVVAADRDVALVIEGSVPGRTAPRSGLARAANAPSVMLPLRHPFDRNLPARQRQIGLGALGECSAAVRRILARTCFATACVALPATTAPRLANVPTPQ